MIYKDADRIETYLTGALEYIQDNKGLRALFNRMSLIDELYTTWSASPSWASPYASCALPRSPSKT